MSEEVYAVADEVVRRTLGDEQPFWLTVGLVFTLWQTSGGARAIMGVVSDVYNHGEDRSFKRSYATSFALGSAFPVLILLAFVVARFGRQLVGLGDTGLCDSLPWYRHCGSPAVECCFSRKRAARARIAAATSSG